MNQLTRAAFCMKFLLTASLLLLSLFSYSQKVTIAPRPSWTTIETPDYKASPSEIENNGSYYLLIDEQINTVRKQSYDHYAYKMMTTEGIQEMSDISVNFDPSYQRLVFHELLIHRGDKKISQLLKENIKVTQREENADRYLYDESLTATINLRDVRVNDVIEYSYTIEGFNPVFGNHLSYKTYFDYGIPYRKFTHRLLTAVSSHLTFKYINGDVPVEESTKNGITTYAWNVENNPALMTDSHAPAWYNPYRHLIVTDFKDWAEVVNWAIKHFTVEDKTHTILKQKLPKEFSQQNKDSLLLYAIRFVQDEIRYLGFESGLNSHKPHDPLKVFEQRFGDCKDKSLLLCSILKQSGIEAYPLLISTTWRDKLTEQLPSANIFDHCVVQVIHNGKLIYIDPTISNQGGSIDNIYFPTFGKGLLIKEGTKEFVDIPPPVRSDISEDQTIEFDKPGGEATLFIRTVYRGGEADATRGQFASSSLQTIQKNYLTFYGNLYPDIEKRDTIHFNDNRRENTFTVEEKYLIKKFWNPNTDAKNQIFCELYPLSMENYFSVTKSTQRKSPYTLNYPLSYYHTIWIKVPQEWTIQPDSKSISSDFYEYNRTVSYTSKEVAIKTFYETKASYVPLESFEKFSEDHQEMKKNLPYYLTYQTPSSVSSEASGISWVALLLCIATVAVSVHIAFRIYYEYDPIPELPEEPGQQIGGWLLLLAIGLAFTPFGIAYSFFVNSEFFNQRTWTMAIESKQWILYFVTGLELFYNSILVIYSALIFVLFFKRRSSLPRLIIIYFSASLAMQVIETAVLVNSGTATDYKALLRIIVASIIWIPYFLYSTRVKETFVERA